jgi:hypothetical protein
MRIWTEFAVLLIVSFCDNSNELSIALQGGKFATVQLYVFSLIACIAELLFYLTVYISC